MSENIEISLRNSYEEFFVQAFAYMHPADKLRFDPYLKVLCDHYQNIDEGDRVVFNLPPRSLKSWTSKIYTAWYLGHNPSNSVLLGSNIQDLAELNLRDIQTIMEASWYKKVFPGTRIAKGYAKNRFRTTRRGGVMAASMRGSVAGYGCDLLQIDDGNKITDATRPEKLQATNDKFSGEFYSRLNNKKKGIVIGIQHRLNEFDLSGHMIKCGYKVVAFPLIAPKDKTYRLSDGSIVKFEKGDVLSDSYSSKDLQLAKQTEIPDYFWFYAQGKGRREDRGIHFKHFKLLQSRMDNGPFVISIDAAQSDGPQHSFHVIQVWQQLPNSYHLFEQFREQCSFPVFQAAAKSLVKKFRPCAVLIESAANGGALYSVLANEFPGFNLIKISPRGTKAERLDRHRKKILNKILSIEPRKAWTVEFLLEFDHFPRRGTDMVDATTQLLNFAEDNPKWHSAPALVTGIAGRRSSDGSPINVSNSEDTGTRGIAIARGIPFFRRF